MKIYKNIYRKYDVDDAIVVEDLFGSRKKFRKQIVRIIESFQGSDRFSIDKKLIYS
jgi:hypothetical protein